MDTELQLLQGRFGFLTEVLAIQEVATINSFAHPHLSLIANLATGQVRDPWVFRTRVIQRINPLMPAASLEGSLNWASDMNSD